VEEIKKTRLRSEWKRIEDSEFYAEFQKILRTEELNLFKALRAESNSRDKDMFLKGQLHELKIVYERLATLVHSIGENLG
jgi:hypothetical protein